MRGGVDEWKGHRERHRVCGAVLACSCACSPDSSSIVIARLLPSHPHATPATHTGIICSVRKPRTMDARGRRPLAPIGLLLLLLAVATTHAFHHPTGTYSVPSTPTLPHHVCSPPPHPTGPSIVSSRRRSALQPCSRPLVLSSPSSPFAPSPPHQRQDDHLEGGRRWQLLPLAAAGGKGFGKKSSREGEGESSKQQSAQQGASKVGYCG